MQYVENEQMKGIAMADPSNFTPIHIIARYGIFYRYDKTHASLRNRFVHALTHAWGNTKKRTNFHEWYFGVTAWMS